MANIFKQAKEILDTKTGSEMTEYELELVNQAIAPLLILRRFNDMKITEALEELSSIISGEEHLNMITVTLEDDGQDFLEWDIRDGVVIESRPFQTWIWKGTKVHNQVINAGDFLQITPPKGSRGNLIHRVTSVIHKN